MAALTDTVRAVPVEGLLPTPAAVRDGAYHLTRHLYLFAPTNPAPEVSRFLDFIHSAEGQAIIGRRHVSLRLSGQVGRHRTPGGNLRFRGSCAIFDSVVERIVGLRKWGRPHFSYYPGLCFRQ